MWLSLPLRTPPHPRSAPWVHTCVCFSILLPGKPSPSVWYHSFLTSPQWWLKPQVAGLQQLQVYSGFQATPHPGDSKAEEVYTTQKCEMILCLLLLTTNLADLVMPSRLARQWLCAAPLSEPTAEGGYPRTGQMPATASPSLSVSAKRPGRPPTQAGSKPPPEWCAATGPAWCPSSRSPGLVALSWHTCPQLLGAAPARCKPGVTEHEGHLVSHGG